MKKRDEEVRKWQKETMKRYELAAAKRMLANAVLFLVVYTLLMMFAVIASSI